MSPQSANECFRPYGWNEGNPIDGEQPPLTIPINASVAEFLRFRCSERKLGHATNVADLLISIGKHKVTR